MAGYKNFAVAGTGEIGTPIIEQLLAQKDSGTVSTVVVLTRQVDTPFAQIAHAMHTADAHLHRAIPTKH